MISKKCAAFILAALLFIAVINGGCGGSSSLLSDSTADINTVINGAWRVDSSRSNNVSVDIDGTEINLSVLDFAFLAGSADMEDITGTVYLEAVAILSSDRVMLPLLMDTRSFDTMFVDDNTWLVGSENGTMSITVDTAAQSPLLHVIGRTPFNGIDTYLDVTFSKVTADSGPATDNEINTFLNGTWQSPADRQTGGGFVYVSISPDFLPELPDDAPELPDDINRTAIVGMMPINASFASIIFNDTDAANKTTNITAQTVLTLAPESGDKIHGPVETLTAYNHPVTNLTREFGSIYKLVLSDTEKAVLLTHGQQAYFIISAVEAGSDGFIQTCALYELEKKPSGNSINFADKAGTLWHSYAVNGDVRYSENGRTINEPLMIDFMELMFPKDGFDINNRSIAVNIAVNYSEFQEPGAAASLDVISISMDKTFVRIDNVGYNTFYAETDSDSGERVMITFLNNNTALLNAQVINREGDFVNLIAMMRKVDEMNDAFFLGGWITGLSNDAAVSIVSPQGEEFNAKVLNFGALISSLDVDAGTANLSAVFVLSADYMLMPMFYENLPPNVTEIVSGEKWTLTTAKGSSLTIEKLGRDEAVITGRLAYKSDLLYSGIDISDFLYNDINIEARVRKANPRDPNAPELDFDAVSQGTWRVMNDWQSGGFQVMTDGSSSSIIYPGIASETFAELELKEGNVIYGLASMGTASFDYTARRFVRGGPMTPFNMAGVKFDITRIVGNFYKLQEAITTADMKGVLILEGEKNARMIISFANELGGTGSQSSAGIRLYSVLHLEKIDAAEVSIMNLNNSSWSVKHGAGDLVFGSGTNRQGNMVLTTDFPGAAKLQSLDVRIHDGSETLKTARFDVTAQILTPTGQVIPYTLDNALVNIERVAPDMFLARTASGRSEFIVLVLDDDNRRVFGAEAVMSANIYMTYNGQQVFFNPITSMTQDN